MKTTIMPFQYHTHPVRVVMQEAIPWWIAKDVCDILEISKHRDALARLDADERGSVVVDTPGGSQTMGAVNESGLYHLIFQSRKAEANAFRKWVTADVLPQIRRTGRYRHLPPDEVSLATETVIALQQQLIDLQATQIQIHYRLHPRLARDTYRQPVTPAERDDMLRLRLQGEALRDIALCVNRPVSTVRHVLRGYRSLLTQDHPKKEDAP